MPLLKINDKCQIINLDTEIVYGTLFKRDDGTIYFRGNTLMTTSWSPEMFEQLDKILKEVNNEGL